jgi:hypothetical protein
MLRLRRGRACQLGPDNFSELRVLTDAPIARQGGDDEEATPRLGRGQWMVNAGQLRIMVCDLDEHTAV